MRTIHACFATVVPVLGLAISSCAPAPPIQTEVRRAEPILYAWHDDGGPGKVSVRISLTDQIAEFERGGRDIGWCFVATGREGRDTKPGEYKITEKLVDKVSNRWGRHEDEFGNIINPSARIDEEVPPGAVWIPADMPYWMRLTSYGIGLHGGPIPRPGQTASAGCIRLPENFVPRLFEAVEIGTPVTITNGPSRYGQRAPVEDAAPPMLAAEQRVPAHAGRVIGTRPMTSAERAAYRRPAPIY